MTTLKERFDEEYKKGAFLFPNLGQPNWDGVIAFFKAELEALAQTMQDEAEKHEPAYADSDEIIVETFSKAARLIRNRAAELA
jgi:hypothetical protein